MFSLLRMRVGRRFGVGAVARREGFDAVGFVVDGMNHRRLRAGGGEVDFEKKFFAIVFDRHNPNVGRFGIFFDGLRNVDHRRTFYDDEFHRRADVVDDCLQMRRAVGKRVESCRGGFAAARRVDEARIVAAEVERSIDGVATFRLDIRYAESTEVVASRCGYIGIDVAASESACVLSNVVGIDAQSARQVVDVSAARKERAVKLCNRLGGTLLDGYGGRIDEPFAQLRQLATCLLAATDLRYGKVEVERKPAEFLQAQLYRVA